MSKAKIEGIEEALKSFKNMSFEAEDMDEILIPAATIIRDAARKNVEKYSYNVAQNFDFINKNNARFKYTKLLGIKWGNLTGTDTITTPALASILEFGTRQRIRKDGSSTGFVKPIGWLRRAIDANGGNATDRIAKGVLNVVTKKAKKNNLNNK